MPKSLERAESYDLGPRLEGEDRRVHLATRPAEPGEPSYLVAFFERDQKVLDEVEQDVLAAMELASPSIAPVVEVFRNDTELGVVHAATPGVTLLRWLLTKDAPPLDDGAALQIGLEICEALAAAHDRKDAKQKTSPLVHPELGPHQVLIAYEGPALVFSFGLGPLFETGRATPNDALAYLAPEVRKGGANGTRANTYSAGAILWSLLAREPFAKDGPPLRKKRTDLDLKLTLLIDRALSPSVLKRTVSCSQLAQAIERSGGADPEARARWVKALRETFGTVTMEATCFPGATPPREDTLVPPPQGVPPTATKPTSKG
ncbi:MAG: hypothetical protein KC731_31955, partial [Myxococcales bacterium]|nr:hypothetical protein [Myxococcales bacterium]